MKNFSHLFNLSKANRRGGKNANHDAAKRSQPSASAFVLESLEQRVLMDATLIDTTAVTMTEPAATAAVVTTDKADYSPGETAVITTSDANPLADVANWQKRAGVMIRGRWLPREEIARRLDALSRP